MKMIKLHITQYYYSNLSPCQDRKWHRISKPESFVLIIPLCSYKPVKNGIQFNFFFKSNAYKELYPHHRKVSIRLSAYPSHPGLKFLCPCLSGLLFLLNESDLRVDRVQLFLKHQSQSRGICVTSFPTIRLVVLK